MKDRRAADIADNFGWRADSDGFEVCSNYICRFRQRSSSSENNINHYSGTGTASVDKIFGQNEPGNCNYPKYLFKICSPRPLFHLHFIKGVYPHSSQRSSVTDCMYQVSILTIMAHKCTWPVVIDNLYF